MSKVRSNAVLQTPHDGAPAASADGATCLECGALHAPQTTWGEFCCLKCRQAFNNRRQARAVIIYDLYMALCFERRLARMLGLWSKIYTCAASFRREDHEERQGRRSWRKSADVLSQYAFRFVKVFRVRG